MVFWAINFRAGLGERNQILKFFLISNPIVSELAPDNMITFWE